MATHTHTGATPASQTPRPQTAASTGPHAPARNNNAWAGGYTQPDPSTSMVNRSDSNQWSGSHGYRHNRRRNNNQHGTNLTTYTVVAKYNAETPGARLVLTRPEILALQAWMDSRYTTREEYDKLTTKAEVEVVRQQNLAYQQWQSEELDVIRAQVAEMGQQVEQIKQMYEEKILLMQQKYEGKNGEVIEVDPEEPAQKETESVLDDPISLHVELPRTTITRTTQCITTTRNNRHDQDGIMYDNIDLSVLSISPEDTPDDNNHNPHNNHPSCRPRRSTPFRESPGTILFNVNKATPSALSPGSLESSLKDCTEEVIKKWTLSHFESTALPAQRQFE
ncbi:hypothetical protein DFH27DRAFT_645325 [Peziza echinospora]|nr:hypothetical protein DFH27DRAFT_645325 [Peziza echinospora]